VVTAPDIPGHRVGSVLGAGGFATVYRCWQVAVGREVAVKVDNRVLLTERDRRRFFREVTAAGRLSGHPHVIDVYDAGTLGDGRPYLVMELCPAGSLNDAIRRDGPMDAERVRDIGVRLADALAAAHAAGVLHRDIKPANILVNRYGMIGLADFGLASIISARGDQTASREALTPAFSSPETFRGEEPTVLADVYSLAATLYALLAGRPPRFPAGSRPPSLVTIMALHDEPVDDIPGTPPALMALLRRSLSADPAVRPPSAAALRDALAAPPPGLAAPHSLASPPPGQVSSEDAISTGPRDFLADPTSSRPDLAVPFRPDAAQAQGRLTRRRIGLAVVLIAVLAGAALTAARLLPNHTGTGSTPGQTSGGGQTAGNGQGAAANGRSTGSAAAYGVATVSTGCPAASAGVATARCPATPECWGGLVVISGAASAESTPCQQPHDWETFAVAILPASVRTFDQPTVAANPAVTRLCSMRVLLQSRQPVARRLPDRAWRIEVLPPSEAAFDTGARAYRCIANDYGNEPSTSQFRR
jgi:serine/threonine protein kinase